MSTQERSDDPREYGYGSTGQDSNIDDAANAVNDPAGEPENAGDTSEETANRRAAASSESPCNVTLSTRVLTVGGSEKDPDHTEESSSASKQAPENQARDLESGKEAG